MGRKIRREEKVERIEYNLNDFKIKREEGIPNIKTRSVRLYDIAMKDKFLVMKLLEAKLYCFVEEIPHYRTGEPVLTARFEMCDTLFEVVNKVKVLRAEGKRIEFDTDIRELYAKYDSLVRKDEEL